MMIPSLLALATLFTAQVESARIVGTVVDGNTGDPLSGVVVSLARNSRYTVTDASGRYELGSVPSGFQPITVRLMGYASRTIRALVPRRGIIEINVALRPQPVVLPVIAVRGPPAGNGKGALAYPDRASSLDAVRNHPLLSEPDALRVLGGGEVILAPERPHGVHIRGAPSDQTAFLLDDVPVFTPYHGSGVFSAWNPDALSRIQLVSSAPPPSHPHALAGTVAAVTRTPAPFHTVRGGASNTQARLTVDGPLFGGAGYLVSLRSAFPGLGPRRDPAAVRGEIGDRLVKVELPAWGGRLRWLEFGSEDEIHAAAEPDPPETRVRNAFAWSSSSRGLGWQRTIDDVNLRVQAWRAAGDADAGWQTPSGTAGMTTGRVDVGLLAAVERQRGGATTTIGARVEHMTTHYRVERVGRSTDLALAASSPIASLFVSQGGRIGAGIGFDFGGSATAHAGSVRFAPRGQVRWRVASSVTVSAGVARLHQYAQSLRNPESIVANVFPADLFAGAPGVPVARADQIVIGADYHPRDAIRLAGQVYRRTLSRVVLVAPSNGEPFATRGFVVGSGTARGAAMSGTVSSRRVAVIANYGVQRVRFVADGLQYTPSHGATHHLETGAVVFPDPTSSVRLGLSGAFGRRGTMHRGSVDYETCTLGDGGCEFSGSPLSDGDGLGAVPLPAYVRVDVSARKEWTMALGGRSAVVAVYATLTNVLGRSNVLTFASDTEGIHPIDMRPRAPLVLGFDWRY